MIDDAIDSPRAHSPGASTRANVFAWSTAVLALGLACWSAVIYFGWAGNRNSMIGLLETSGIDDAGVIGRVAREPVAHHARLDTARALMFSLLNATPLEQLAAAERVEAKAARREQLRNAFELSRGALAQQPNNWEAAMIQGATTYLLWSLERDRRLFTEADTWQAPLIKAWREAPARREPRRILGTAYLELWPALSAEKRRFASDLLATTFAEDPDAFARLGPIWLDTMADTDRALEIIPDTPRAWEITSRYFAANGRWPRVREAHLRGLDSLEQALTTRLADGERRLTLGDTTTSRTRFARVIGDAPADQRFVPYVNRALHLYPAGLQTAGTGDSMSEWLRFAIDLAAVGKDSLEETAINRLGGVVQGLPEAESALAALAGGDAALAERLERLDRSHGSSAWAPYLITKARWLLARGGLDEAAATLGRVGAMGVYEPVYWQTRRDVATARNDRDARLESELWLERIAAAAWPATGWRPSRDTGTHRLVMLTAEDAPGLTVGIDGLPPRGGVLRLRLDGATVHVAPVKPRSRMLRVETPITAGMHLLEWSILTHGDAIPGAVRLLDATP